MVDLDAYAADCRLHGLARLPDGRLTDLLNATTELEVVDARLESLDDGHVVDAERITVTREELCAVVAAGPRGDSSRRLATRSTRVLVDLGPYRVEGLIHGTPASDPISLALRRAAWLPVTEATVRYERAGLPVCDEVDTLLVNRTFATSMRAVHTALAALPGETPRTPPAVATGAMDLTGELVDPIREPGPEAPRAPEPPV